MVKFKRKQNPVIDSELKPSTPDLIMGDRTTAIIGGKHSQSIYMTNFKTSNLPKYGAGKLDSFEFDLNVSNVAYGERLQRPRFDMYLLDTEATTEGAMTSSTGDTTIDQNYLVYSYTPTQSHVNIAETLKGYTIDDIVYNSGTPLTEEFQDGFISIEDAEKHLISYSISEAKHFGISVDDPNGLQIGLRVKYEEGYCDVSTESIGNDIIINGYGANAQYNSTCYNNTNGLYIVSKNELGIPGNLPPPHGRMYLDNKVTSTSPHIKYKLTRFATAEEQIIEPASSSDTTIFNHFETTRDFTFTSGTGNDAAPSQQDEVEGAVATIQFEEGKSVTNKRSLQLRTFQKLYSDFSGAYSFTDGASLTGRQYSRLDALDIPAPTIHDSGSNTTSVSGCSYNNDPTVTVSSTQDLQVGMIVTGTGIPEGSTISSITNDTTFELSASTTGGSKSSQTLVFQNTHEAPSLGQTIKFNMCIPKMAPAFKYHGVADASLQLKLFAKNVVSTGNGGIVELIVDLDDSTYDFDDVNRTFLSDDLQYLVGSIIISTDVDDTATDYYQILGVKSTGTARVGDTLVCKRVGHTTQGPQADAVMRVLASDTGVGTGQLTSERGLFFIMSSETIAENLSHTGAFKNHGRREDASSNPDAYIVPDSALEWGIVYDPALEGTNFGPFRVVTNGGLFKHGQKIWDDVVHTNGINESMVNYSTQGTFDAAGQKTGVGFNDLIANSPQAGNVENYLNVDFDEWFTMVLECSPDDEDMRLYFINNDGDNLLAGTDKFVRIYNINDTVKNYKEPTASASKWPSNLYIYLNNRRDMRNSATANADEVESDYWLTYDDSSDDSNTNFETESVVNIDSIIFENFWPNSGNSTVHSNNYATKAPVSIKGGSMPSSPTLQGMRSDPREWKEHLTKGDYSYICIGHHSATSLSGDNSYVPLFFDGFSKPLSGLDATQALSNVLIDGFGISSNEPLGYQLTGPSMDNDLNGYGTTSFDVTGDQFDNEKFTHKGVGVLRFDADDEATGAYPYQPNVQAAREHILASAKVLKILDSKRVVVDAPNKLHVDFGKDTTINQRFILYEYGKAYDDTNYRNDLQIEKIEGNIVTFSGDISADTDGNADQYTPTINTSNLYVSPKAHWVTLRLGPQVVGQFEDRYYNGIYRVARDANGADFTPGVTYNEFLYNDGLNTNSWDLIVKEDSNVVTDTDFGFGSMSGKQDADPTETGYVASKWCESGRNIFNISKKIIDSREKELGDVLPFIIQPRTFSDAAVTVTTNNNGTASNKPICLTVFEDELPKITDFTVSPDENNPFFPKFKWECQADDLWYGFLLMNDETIHNQYKNAVLHYPLNESGADLTTISTVPVEQISNVATAVSGVVYDIEGLAGNCVRFDGNDFVRSGTGSADPLGGALTEASFVMHVVHDAAAIGADQHILYKNQVVEVKVNSSDIIVAHLYWDTNSYVELTSTSLMPIDGETPMNIIVTLDTTLVDGNVKLFINGKLEDQSGLHITSDATGARTGWLKDTGLETNNNQLFIGSANTSTGFVGRIEEVVVYNKAIYPFTGRDKELLFTKPLQELQDTTVSSSRPYSGKVFLKDYHNIRGVSVSEVATAPPVSFKKAAFRIDGA